MKSNKSFKNLTSRHKLSDDNKSLYIYSETEK